jgi:hypothetical protein
VIVAAAQLYDATVKKAEHGKPAAKKSAAGHGAVAEKRVAKKKGAGREAAGTHVAGTRPTSTKSAIAARRAAAKNAAPTKALGRKPARNKPVLTNPASRAGVAALVKNDRAAATDMVSIPSLGQVRRDSYGALASDPVMVPALGRTCVFELRGYPTDAHPEDFHAAIANLLAAGPALLHSASRYVLQYCQDSLGDTGPDDLSFEEAAAQGLRDLGIAVPADVWNHVRIGDTVTVGRDRSRKRDVYLSCECNCDWVQEHGLQLVFRNGRVVNKVGPSAALARSGPVLLARNGPPRDRELETRSARG